MSLRIAIIGNSGSGKSHLARRIVADLGVPLVDVDEIFWLPTGFHAKRPAEEVDRLVAELRSGRAWVVEGVFGDLVTRVLDLADLLIWLDLPWKVCEASLLERGSVSSMHMGAAEAEESFQKLLAWSSEYWTRTDLRSHVGHKQMYDDFPGQKRRFTVRREVDAYPDSLRNQVAEIAR